MNIVPLTVEHLDEARRVAAELFPWETEHQAALAAAVAPGSHQEFLAARGLASVRCWIGLRKGIVAGLVCLYSYAEQAHETWLAWFGLRPAMRGRGDGARLLDWCIACARDEGRRTLRLWTTDEAEYADAMGLYVRRGFVTEDCPPLPGEDWTTFVLSLGLDCKPPASWRESCGRRGLCGRVEPSVAAAA